jgi:hypothetical protein
MVQYRGKPLTAPPTERVEIFVSGDTKIAGRSIINPNRPTDLVIYCNANCPVYVVTGDNDVAVAGTSEFRGAIPAPKTVVTLTGNDEFKGVVLAHSAYAHGSAGIHYDEDLSTIFPVRGFSIPVGWSDSD